MNDLSNDEVIERLKKWKEVICEFDDKMELRLKGYNGSGPYIVGFHYSSDTSYRVSYMPSVGQMFSGSPAGFTFTIQKDGNTLLNRFVILDDSELGFDRYYALLSEIICYHKSISKKVTEFSNFSIQEKRNKKLEGIV